ncbi:MAG: hypothetical protein ACRELX_08825, partial [Longimicrobiales bacterium]
LEAVVGHAAGLGASEPANDLWPGILGRIGEEHGRVIPLSSAAGAPSAPAADDRARRRTPRFTFSLPQLVAAAVLVAFVSGGAVWLALHSGAGADPMFVEAAAPLPAAASADSTNVRFAAVRAYDQAIEQLEQELDVARGRLDPETVAIIERNLEVIDAAIAEARQALARDPANAFLYRHLDNTLTKKIEILRRVTTIGRGPA